MDPFFEATREANTAGKSEQLLAFDHNPKPKNFLRVALRIVNTELIKNSSKSPNIDQIKKLKQSLQNSEKELHFDVQVAYTWMSLNCGLKSMKIFRFFTNNY